MNNKLKAIFTVLTIVLLASCSKYEKVADDLAFLTPDYFQCTVMKVYSGDKFLCQLPGLDTENVTLVGIEIPPEEREEAKKYTKSLLKRGTLIKIEIAKNQMDNSGDIPAYVFVPGNKMLNLLLIERGLAEPNIEEIDKYKENFIQVKESIEVEIIEEKSN